MSWSMRSAHFKSGIAPGISRGCPLGKIAVAGLLKHHAGMPEKPMRILGNYALVYLLHGNGTFKDALGAQLKLSAGDMWLVFPDVAHWYGPDKGSLWDEIFIVFSGPIFDLWRAKGLLDPAKPIWRLEPLDYWLRRLHDVGFIEADALQQLCLFQHLLAEAVKISKDLRAPHWLENARALLQSGNETPEKVARALGMSYETFRKRFRSAAGVPPRQYQRMKEMDKACALMATEELTNKAIADRLNFCDEFHFSRRFKQIMGLTPTQFRLKMPARVDHTNRAACSSPDR